MESRGFRCPNSIHQHKPNNRCHRPRHHYRIGKGNNHRCRPVNHPILKHHGRYGKTGPRQSAFATQPQSADYCQRKHRVPPRPPPPRQPTAIIHSPVLTISAPWVTRCAIIKITPAKPKHSPMIPIGAITLTIHTKGYQPDNQWQGTGYDRGKPCLQGLNRYKIKPQINGILTDAKQNNRPPWNCGKPQPLPKGKANRQHQNARN